MLKFGLETGTVYSHSVSVADIKEEYILITGAESENRDYLIRLMNNYKKVKVKTNV